jgi:hypothetical protein
MQATTTPTMLRWPPWFCRILPSVLQTAAYWMYVADGSASRLWLSRMRTLNISRAAILSFY